VAVCGARLWDTPEYSFGKYIQMMDNPRANKLIQVEEPAAVEKIFAPRTWAFGNEPQGIA